LHKLLFWDCRWKWRKSNRYSTNFITRARVERNCRRNKWKYKKWYICKKKTEKLEETKIIEKKEDTQISKKVENKNVSKPIETQKKEVITETEKVIEKKVEQEVQKVEEKQKVPKVEEKQEVPKVEEKQETVVEEKYTEVVVNVAERRECTGNNHSTNAGNSGLWFNSYAEADSYYDTIIADWGTKWETGKITKEEYLEKCPSGFEVWTCPVCSKYTLNFYYR